MQAPGGHTAQCLKAGEDSTEEISRFLCQEINQTQKTLLCRPPSLQLGLDREAGRWGLHRQWGSTVRVGARLEKGHGCRVLQSGESQTPPPKNAAAYSVREEG